MISILCALCAGLGLLCIALLVKIVWMHRAAEELGRTFAQRLAEDTNVGMDLLSGDKYMRRLAAELDGQLKQLRAEHIRYTQGDQELKNAVAGISHDLRTPLTAVCGYMELLKQEEVSDTVREYLGIIENRIWALRDLIEELFRYSVILSVEHYDEREALSLNEALEECLAAHYGAFKEAGIEPEISLPRKDVRRSLNRQALSRTLANIVSNGIKYSDGDFVITLTEEGTIHFSNHAHGLDEIQVGHLFDRFYTVESARTSTGLGLSIAKTLVENMQGKIKASYACEVLNITVSFSDA